MLDFESCGLESCGLVLDFESGGLRLDFKSCGLWCWFRTANVLSGYRIIKDRQCEDKCK